MLPLILMVAALFISPGIFTPTLSPPGEAGLRTPQKGKPTTCAVVKAQAKSPQLRVVKAAQPFDLCTVATLSGRVPHFALRSNSEPLTIHVYCTSSIPARAPPA
ncbi:MAG TPA: hypothetical protein VFF53_11960 [Geobacteraceae bacterium]|nr:hypothetical protein [Geobacteraceae bacterium]